MNRQTTLVLCAVTLLALSAVATDILTTDGLTFRSAEVKAVERDGLRIVHADGAAFIPFQKLPLSMQARYGWTKERAQQVADEKAQEEARADQARRVAADAAAEAQRRADQAEAEAAVQRKAEADAEKRRLQSERRSQEAAETAAKVARVCGTIIFITLVACAYFLPTIVGRRKQNAGAIFIFNLLLGWTFLGWAIALVWAFTKDQQPAVNHYTVINQGSPVRGTGPRAIQGRVVN